MGVWNLVMSADRRNWTVTVTRGARVLAKSRFVDRRSADRAAEEVCRRDGSLRTEVGLATPGGIGARPGELNVTRFEQIMANRRPAAGALAKSTGAPGAVTVAARPARTRFGVGCCACCGVSMPTAVGAPDLANTCASCKASGNAADILQYLRLFRRPGNAALDTALFSRVLDRITDEQRAWCDALLQRGAHDSDAGPLPKARPHDDLRRSSADAALPQPIVVRPPDITINLQDSTSRSEQMAALGRAWREGREAAQAVQPQTIEVRPQIHVALKPVNVETPRPTRIVKHVQRDEAGRIVGSVELPEYEPVARSHARAGAPSSSLDEGAADRNEHDRAALERAGVLRGAGEWLRKGWQNFLTRFGHRRAEWAKDEDGPGGALTKVLRREIGGREE